MQSPTKTVHYYDGSWTIGVVQGLYLDRETRRLIPNVSFVRSDGSIFFEINEIGLKGDALDSARKTAVVWGDSVVFGIGRGWPRLLDRLSPGYQWLNGGIEGAHYRDVLRYMAEVNRKRPIAVNVVLPGWHPHGQNQDLEADLTAACREVPHPVLATMPTALNPRVLNTDLTPLFSPKLEDWDRMYWVSELSDPQFRGFYFYGGFAYSVAMQREAFQHILERNSMVRRVAAALGIPLVDLFAVLDTSGSADIREDFNDIVHPRPSAYAKIVEAVFSVVRRVL